MKKVKEKSLYKDTSADELFSGENLSVDERNAAIAELQQYILKASDARSPKEIFEAKLYRLQLLLEDQIGKDSSNQNYDIAWFIKSYIDALGTTKQQFAQEINIHKTLLSQYINNLRQPNEDFLRRMTVHSNHILNFGNLYTLIFLSRLKSVQEDQVEWKRVKAEVKPSLIAKAYRHFNDSTLSSTKSKVEKRYKKKAGRMLK